MLAATADELPVVESVSTVGASGYWSCCCCCDHGRWWGGRRLGTNVALLKSVKASNFATDNRGTWKALSSTRCRNFPRLASLCAITLSRSLRLEIPWFEGAPKILMEMSQQLVGQGTPSFQDVFATISAGLLSTSICILTLRKQGAYDGAVVLVYCGCSWHSNKHQLVFKEII